jgi:hypothetical protein
MTTVQPSILIVSPVVIPTIVPLVAVIVIVTSIAVVPVVILVGFSAVVPAATAMVLIPVGRHNAAAQQCNGSGKQHKNELHKSLLIDIGLYSGYAPRCQPAVSNGFRTSDAFVPNCSPLCSGRKKSHTTVASVNVVGRTG